MSANEILIAIRQLPVEEQKKLLKDLSEGLEEIETETDADDETEFLQSLLAKGIISEIPDGLYEDDEDFEPIEVIGKPLSETIIEERR